MTEELMSLKLTAITPSPTNPRKTFDKAKLEELAKSIQGQGVLQPILVRPAKKKDHYEIVFGERRFRATKMAGLDSIPAFVRHMTDQDVVEAQLVENQEREDVHPLEEADGYRMLIDRFECTAEDVAARLGVSRAHVYARLKLCELCKEGRDAYLEGKLTAATAVYVARLNEKLQPKAVEELTPAWLNGRPMPAKDASALIQRKYMLRLAGAPFNVKDADLVKDAPACAECPKRTGAQSELFADVASDDVCTDPSCFSKKKTAAWREKAAKYKERGIAIVKGKEARSAVLEDSYTQSWSAGPEYVKASEKIEGDEQGRTYKKVLGTPDLVVKLKDGRPAELFKREGLKKRLADAGVASKVKGPPREPQVGNGRAGTGIPVHLINHRADQLVAVKVAEAGVAAPILDRLRFLAAMVIDDRDIPAIFPNADLPMPPGKPLQWGGVEYKQADIDEVLAGATEEQLWRVLIESNSPGYHHSDVKTAFGLNISQERKSVRKQARTDVKAQLKAQAEEKKKAEAEKKAAEKPKRSTKKKTDTPSTSA